MSAHDALASPFSRLILQRVDIWHDHRNHNPDTAPSTQLTLTLTLTLPAQSTGSKLLDPNHQRGFYSELITDADAAHSREKYNQGPGEERCKSPTHTEIKKPPPRSPDTSPSRQHPEFDLSAKRAPDPVSDPSPSPEPDEYFPGNLHSKLPFPKRAIEPKESMLHIYCCTILSALSRHN